MAVDVSSEGAADGKITGLSAEKTYIYKKEGEDDYYEYTGGTEITGLTAGTYLIKIKVKRFHEYYEAKEVVIIIKTASSSEPEPEDLPKPVPTPVPTPYIPQPEPEPAEASPRPEPRPESEPKQDDNMAIENWVNPFQDIRPEVPHYEAVRFVSAKGYMNSMGDGQFSPNQEMNRAMLVTVLYRMAGMPELPEGQHPFQDIKNNSWYGKAAVWASQSGIVKGVQANLFAPNLSLTREQMAQLIRNYALYQKKEIKVSGNLKAFKDAGQVSDWASEAMLWAYENGLMSGKGDGLLMPHAKITRGEMAALLQHLEKGLNQ